MSKFSSKNPPKTALAKRNAGNQVSSTGFDEVLALIEAARTRAFATVNTALIDLYWSIGEHIAKKIAEEGWGKGTVQELAGYIQRRQANARGFSASNLWRMMQFYDTYRAMPELAPVVRELSWTHNLLIMSRSKRDEEREFYLRLCVQEKWSSHGTKSCLPIKPVPDRRQLAVDARRRVTCPGLNCRLLQRLLGSRFTVLNSY